MALNLIKINKVLPGTAIVRVIATPGVQGILATESSRRHVHPDNWSEENRQRKWQGVPDLLTNRRGYDEKYHCKGLLPRLKKDKPEPPLKSMPMELQGEDFKRPFHSKKVACFGQNDYIDILGNPNIHPARMLTNVPWWLRGFKGNEFQQLVRRREACKNMRFENPHKWYKMNYWMTVLYKKINYRYKPPPAEY